jgi:hypothetical protein
MPIQRPFAVIPHPLGTVTTGNERANRPAIHLGQFRDPGMVWQSNGNANLWVRGNFGSARPVDFVSLISTNAQAGTTARLRLGDSQAAVDGTASYDSGNQIIISPSITREDGRYVWHWELPSLQTRQWWRIDIGSHTGDFQAAALVMGQEVQFADFYNQTGFEFGQEDAGEIDFGRFGVIEEVGGMKWRTLAMDFGWMSDSDRHTKFQPLRDKLGKTGVALWVFDPDATVQRQDKTYFGWLRSPVVFKPSTFKQDRFQASFDIISMI